jgi:hypothetical protein
VRVIAEGEGSSDTGGAVRAIVNAAPEPMIVEAVTAKAGRIRADDQ